MDDKLELALKELHDAIDSIDRPRGVLVQQPDGTFQRLGGRYYYVLRALRKFTRLDGKPLQNTKFLEFFQRQLFRTTLNILDNKPEVAAALQEDEGEKFVRTVLRLCGGEVFPDGTMRVTGISRTEKTKKIKQIDKMNRSC